MPRSQVWCRCSTHLRRHRSSVARVCLWVDIVSYTFKVYQPHELSSTVDYCSTFPALPSYAENQTLLQLYKLSLDNNQLDGRLPEAWSNLTSVSPLLY